MQEDTLQQQIQRTKKGLLIAMSLMIVGILAAFYLYLELQYKNKEIEENNRTISDQRDSLEHFLQLVSLYKDSLEITLSKVNKGFVARTDTALANRISILLEQSATLSKNPIEAVFDSNRTFRASSLQYLLQNKRNDPQTIREMIRIGKASISDAKGTVNVLYYLNANDAKALKPFASELLEYLDLIDRQAGRQQAKDLSASIRNKLR